MCTQKLKQITLLLLVSGLSVLSGIMNVAQSTHNAISDIAWSPDGKLVAVATSNQTVEVLDAETRQTIQTLRGYEAEVFAVGWNQDGTRLASADAAGHLLIWNTNTWELVVRQTSAIYSDLHVAFFDLAWNPDGSQIIVSDSLGLISLYDARTGNRNPTWFLGHQNFVSSVDWSPDGRYIVSGDWNSQLILWDAVTGEQLVVIDNSDLLESVNAVSWDPDGSLVAVAGSNGQIHVWDPFNEIMVESVQAHASDAFRGAMDVQWLMDGKRLASGGGDQKLYIWEADNLQRIDTMTTDEVVYSLDVNPITNEIAYFQGGLVIVLPAQAVTGFMLVDADADEDIRPLADGDTITEETITIRVETEPPRVGSVVFGLNEEPRFKVENEDAYALKGDDNGDYHAWLAEPGTYRLTATPYTEADGQGEAGTPLTITFTVEAPGS